MKKIYITSLFFLTLTACENRDLNEGEKFRPRELHDNFDNSHFTKVEVDGVEYLMLERDNNNPHEGFGFMAFRANKLTAKQDTLIAYMKAIAENQKEILSLVSRKSRQEVDAQFEENLNKFLREESAELTRLNRDSLSAVEK
jgi:hypothetical protein